MPRRHNYLLSHCPNCGRRTLASYCKHCGAQTELVKTWVHGARHSSQRESIKKDAAPYAIHHPSRDERELRELDEHDSI